MTSGWFRARWRDLALPVGAFLITLLVFLPFARIGVDPHHDGVMLKPAMDVLAGQHLFRDTFMQYGPLTTYIQVGFLAAFGKTLYALKLGTVLAYALASALLVLAWRRLLPDSLTVLSYLLWLTLPAFYQPDIAMLPWSSVFALVFQSASLYLLLRSSSSERPGPLALVCGACAGLTFWCRMPVGVCLVGSLAIAYLILGLSRRGRRWRWGGLVFFVVGTLAALLALAAFLATQGSLRDWYFQNVKWPGIWARTNYWFSQLPGLPGRVISSLFELRYFYNIVVRFYNPFYSLGLVLALLSLAGVVIVILCMELARPSEASLIRRALRSRFAPPIFLFGGLAAFLSLTAVLSMWATDLSPWDRSTIHPWTFLVPLWILAATAVLVLQLPCWGGGECEGQEGWGGDLRLAGLLASLVALASWLQYFPMNDPRHLFWAVSPCLGVLVFHAWQWSRLEPRIMAIGLAALAVPLVAERFQAAREELTSPYFRIGGDSFLSGMRVPPREEQLWTTLLDVVGRYTEGHHDVAMLIEGDDAFYATLVPDLSNPTPFFINWPALPLCRDVSERRERFIAERRPLIHVQANRLPRAEAIIAEYGYTPLVKLEASGDVILHPSERPPARPDAAAAKPRRSALE